MKLIKMVFSRTTELPEKFLAYSFLTELDIKPEQVFWGGDYQKYLICQSVEDNTDKFYFNLSTKETVSEKKTDMDMKILELIDTGLFMNDYPILQIKKKLVNE